jgi:hypothetical protein
MPDATDSNALVPHQLEELFNVNTTEVSVGDVLTVTEVVDGSPVWEAAAASADGAWLPITLSTDDSDWTLSGEDMTFTDGVLAFSAGDATSTVLTGDGVALLASSRRTEVRFTIRCKRDDSTTWPGESLVDAPVTMSVPLDEADRLLFVQYAHYEDRGGSDFQVNIADGFGQDAWAAIADPTDWTTIVATFRTPTFRSGYTVTVDDEYGSTLALDPDAEDAVAVRFEIASEVAAAVSIDLAETMIEVRAI